jgi:hypothetical protein
MSEIFTKCRFPAKDRQEGEEGALIPVDAKTS